MKCSSIKNIWERTPQLSTSCYHPLVDNSNCCCWLHRSTHWLQSLYLNLGTCYYSWTPYPNSNMVGGIPQRDTTLDGCQARCISIPECTGIDIDSRPGNQYCWLHTSTNLYLFPSTSVDHYQLRRSPYCPETSEFYEKFNNKNDEYLALTSISLYLLLVIFNNVWLPDIKMIGLLIAIILMTLIIIRRKKE